jgi:hypothetical protein
MLEHEELEVVFIVTNFDETGRPRYPTLPIDCLRAGAHAWIEKPPASSSAEIQEMIRVSSETKRHVAIGFKKMFFPANVRAKEIVSRPEFGPITSITARGRRPRRKPGGRKQHSLDSLPGFQKQRSVGSSGDYFGAFTDDSAPVYWEPEFSLGQLYNKSLFLLGYAPEVTHFTSRALEGRGPDFGTLQDALELLKIYEAYLQPDQMISRIVQ